MTLKLTVQNQLRIEGASPDLRSYIKGLLTLLNPAWVEAEKFGRWTGSVPKHIYQFEETKDTLLVPRGLLEHLLFDLDLRWDLEDLRVDPKADWPESGVTLRPNDQETAVDNVLQHNNGFLVAPAGSGKTIMGLEIGRRLGLKTLWLVHQDHLKDQAIEEAVENFNFEEKDIGVLQGRHWEIGKTLTIGMIPTLKKRDLSPILNAFGTIIVDEAHHAPSTTFLEVITYFNARNVFGLTATAYRRDKLDAVMFNAIGPKVAEIEHAELFEEEHLMIPTIICRNTGWYPPNAQLMDYQDFMAAMIDVPERNALIVQDVVRECRAGNICIILVDRTKHAEILADLLKEKEVKCEFLVSAVDVDQPPAEKRKGKNQKKKKRAIPKKVRDKITADFKSGSLQVVVTTYDLLKEGFNYKPLNRLFFAAPMRWKGAVVQSLGRIQRPAQGKVDAIAYDYIDDALGMFVRQADSRFFSVYKAMNMSVIYKQDRP